MKKIFISILIIFNTFVFAETGALGFQWGEPFNSKKVETPNLKLNELDSAGWLASLELGYQNRKILTEYRDVLYSYYKNDDNSTELESICYTLNDNYYVKMLKEKLTYSHKLINVPTQLSNFDLNENEKIFFNNFFDNIIYLSEFAIDYEQNGSSGFFSLMIKNIYDKTSHKDGTISIYDYNDDTRVYIFENIIDETVVVYVPHERDY